MTDELIGKYLWINTACGFEALQVHGLGSFEGRRTIVGTRLPVWEHDAWLGTQATIFLDQVASFMVIDTEAEFVARLKAHVNQAGFDEEVEEVG